MFTARRYLGLLPCLPSLIRTGRGSTEQASPAAGILRLAAVSGFLALSLPETSSAQALGTMQVTARVIPASVAWSGVAEAGLAARSVAQWNAGRPLIQRNGLVHTRAEIRPTESRPLLVVTVHYPHN
jgi:hypothetical protein